MGLLKIVNSRKNSIQQKLKTKSVAGPKGIQIACDISKLCYTNEQFIISTRGNEALFGKLTNPAYSHTFQRKIISNLDSDSIEGVRCNCFTCRRKCFDISQQKQNVAGQTARQVRMTNDVQSFREQQMMKHRPEQKSTTRFSAKHNIHQGNYYKPTRKRARLSTAVQKIPVTTISNNISSKIIVSL